MNGDKDFPRTKEKDEVAQGAERHAQFPLVVTESKTPSGSISTEVRRGHGETILVIDDDVGVRDVLCSLLKILGYVPLIAEDGSRGLTLYREHQQQVKVVITDMMMPGMQGLEVIREIRAINSDSRIVAMGGLLLEQTEIIEETGRLTFLHKPMTGTELLDALGRVMPRSV
ncbi:MAG TPA: response regulator [Lacunisphaera sp.]|jgi:hypothetical protein